MKRVAVIGGGVAGMQTALRLAEQGIEPVIIEKEAELGGKLRGWHVLFPSFTPASEILTELRRRVAERGIEVLTQTEAAGFTREGVRLTDGRTIACDSVVLCSGFTLFDASIKEEYGYGIYDNVFTTVDIERMLNEGRVAKADGSRPKRIAFLHCVGSRDEKVCQQHCSKVCCITGVKQAMEMKQLFPDADVFNFYMDIRMFGPGYEEMYREAQQKYNIHFIRPAPCAERFHGAARHVLGQREEQRGGHFLRRNRHGAEEYRRIVERSNGRCRRCGPISGGIAYGGDQFRIYHLQAAGDRHRPQQPAQERRNPARNAGAAGLHRMRGLHGGLHGRKSHGVQFPQGSHARPPRRVSGCLRGDEQMHALRQMPAGVSARYQHARRSHAYQT